MLCDHQSGATIGEVFKIGLTPFYAYESMNLCNAKLKEIKAERLTPITMDRKPSF